MLEKQKEWCHEKTEKGRKWIDGRKTVIGFGLGMAAMAGIYSFLEKVNEPKGGSISFAEEKWCDNHVIGRVYCNNRFGKERQLLAIDYGKEGEGRNPIKHICDDLNEIVYPGD